MDISSFIYVLIFTCAVSAAVKRLCPEPTAKYAGYLCGVAVLTVTLSPLLSLFKESYEPPIFTETVIIEEIGEYSNMGIGLLEAQTEELLCQKTSDFISERTGVHGFECLCHSSFGQSGALSFLKVELYCDSYSAFTVLKMKEESLRQWLCGLFCCDVELLIYERT